MKEGKVYGRGSGRLCRVLLALSLLLFLALPQLAAWPMLQGKEAAEEAAIAMTEEPIAEEASQKEPSGTALKDISTEQSRSLEKAEQGKRLSGDESEELYLTLVEARDEAKAARASSEAKSAEISALKARLASAEEEAGTKAYLMLDGIVGFKDVIPQFGVGLTVGTRLGNSLMVELGADYMVGGMDGYSQFDIDNFQFRCGVGWMF